MKELSEKQKLLINAPTLREQLNPKHLNKPLPPFNTVKRINNLSDTQVCMAMDAFLENIKNHKVSKLTYKDKDLLFTRTELHHGNRAYPGILDSNEPMITTFINECLMNETYNIQNVDFSRHIKKRGSGEIPLNEIIILFKNMLISSLEIWKIEPKRDNSEQFNRYIYGLASVKKTSLNYCLATKHFKHRYIIDSFFTHNGLLRSNNVLKNKYVDLDLLPLLEDYGINITRLLDTLYEEYNNGDYHAISNHYTKKYDLSKVSYDLANSFISDFPYLYNLNATLIFESLFLSLPCQYNYTKIKELTPLIISYIDDVLTEVRKTIGKSKRIFVPDEVQDFFKYGNTIVTKYIVQLLNNFITEYDVEDVEETSLPLSWQIEQYILNNPLEIIIPDNVQTHFLKKLPIN